MVATFEVIRGPHAEQNPETKEISFFREGDQVQSKKPLADLWPDKFRQVVQPVSAIPVTERFSSENTVADLLSDKNKREQTLEEIYGEDVTEAYSKKSAVIGKMGLRVFRKEPNTFAILDSEETVLGQDIKGIAKLQAVLKELGK